MPYTGFHSEWVTIENSRVFLECRGSFPGKKMHFIAQVAVEALSQRSEDARLVNVYYDDKSCCHTLTFASDNPEDEGFEQEVVGIINNIYRYANDSAEMVLVERVDRSHDHYVHMEHLSCESGVAVDRWKHADKEYMKDAEVPR